MKRTQTSTYSIVLISVFAALLVVFNYLARIDIGPVPITFQMVIVMLSGNILGSRRAAAAIIIVILLALFHIPTFPAAVGIGLVTSITFGYIIGWVFAAYIIGMFVPKMLQSPNPNWFVIFLICTLVGIGVVYLFGVLWAALFFGKTMAVLWKFFIAPFIIPDIIKAAIVTLITFILHKYRVIIWS